ncbi:MAG TPA: ABC transporter permease [Thermoanaerobaculia bacterium]|nr:ABC transporter permease [Thermoanaerobaculia bacterium]
MILSVVRASWTMLRRDRAAIALSFVVPIVFFSIFALIFGGQRDRATRKVRLLVVDEDRSPRSGRLLEALGRETAIDLRRAPQPAEGEPAPAPYDRAAAEAAVRHGDAAVALIVPEGFGAARFAFGPGEDRPRLELLADSSDPVAPRMVEGLLQKTTFLGLSDLFLEGGIASLDDVAFFTPEQRERLDEMLAQVRERREDPDQTSAGSGAGGDSAGALPVAIETRDLLGETKKNPLIAFYAAGLGVMFLLFTAAGAGGALIEERESGTLDRLLSTRISMGQLLAGKLAYLTSLGLVQLTVMFVWGWAVFGLELPGHLAGFALMAVPTALVSSAFGLVLAAVCTTRKQLVAMSNLVILSISALGGSMFPRFLMPESLQRFSLIAFNSWALEGFLDVFWREEPLTAVIPEIGVLLAWTAVFFLVARRLARRWELV